MTEHDRSTESNTTTATSLRTEGSADNQPLQFPGRSRAEATAFHRDLARGIRPDNLGKPGAQTRRSAKTARRPSSIGVLVPGLTLPKELSGYRHNDVGVLTHAVLAIVAPSLRDVSAERLVEHTLDVAAALTTGDNINRRRALQITASSHARRYLRRYAPAAPWELVGAEFQTETARTDLAWCNPSTGQVFFDEIKTHNRPVAAIAPEVVAQATRQAEGGAAAFGQNFAGVRVIPFGALHLVTLFCPDGGARRIAPSPEQPLPTA